MTAIWPASLPQYARRQGYGITGIDPVDSFNPEKGPPIERSASTVSMSELSLAFIMSLDQLETFKDFVRRVLQHGTTPFVIPHPDSRNQVEARLIGDRKFEIAYYTPLERLVSIKVLLEGEDA